MLKRKTFTLKTSVTASQIPVDPDSSTQRSCAGRIAHLSAVLDALREDAVLVADAVAVGGQADGGHGVEEAGGQPAEAAVAQAGVLLDVLQLLDVQTHLARRRPGGQQRHTGSRHTATRPTRPTALRHTLHTVSLF